MATGRRIGAENSKSRAALLDATEQVMLEDGYAAVSSRRIAQQAGLKPQLVHYYFRTMEDLFLAAFRRRAEKGLERQSQVLASGQPLRALWAFGNDPTNTALTMEFAALANHHKSIRSEIARYAETFRNRQTEVLAEFMAERGIDAALFPPVAVMTLITGVSQILVMEEALGMSAGHEETRALVARLIEHYDGTTGSSGSSTSE